MNIYFDCKNGISSDMLLAGVDAIVQIEKIKIEVRDLSNHGRHLSQVNDIIDRLDIFDEAKNLAKNIYNILGIAEAKVHEETLESVHFHEVGRDEAIENIVNFSIGITEIEPENIYVTEIKDGRGTVMCSHGEIEVPVPAVKAQMDICDLKFGTRDVQGERVTPTALAMIIGIKAKYVDEIPKDAKKIGIFYGARDIEKKEGLEVLYI